MNPAEKIDAIEAARQAGIDLSLLDSNLAMTYEQRALQHEEALVLALTLGVDLEKDLLTVKDLRAIATKLN